LLLCGRASLLLRSDHLLASRLSLSLLLLTQDLPLTLLLLHLLTHAFTLGLLCVHPFAALLFDLLLT